LPCGARCKVCVAFLLRFIAALLLLLRLVYGHVVVL
jgi:hypothetical protein